MTSEAERTLQTVDADSFANHISDKEGSSARFRAHMDSFVYSKPRATTRSASKPQSNIQDTPGTSSVKSRAMSSAKVKAEPAKSSARKRKSDEIDNEPADLPTHAQKKRSTAKERSAADPRNPTNNLVDSLQPDLMLVFIGLNPGLMTASTGHAYAHPSNHFWRLLHQSGVTPQRHKPEETRSLMKLYSIGNTNICERPTRTGSGLSKQELVEGAAILDEKIAKYKPEAVCIVGKGIWEVIYKAKTGKDLKKNPDFKYGWQHEDLWLGKTFDEDGTLVWAGAKTFLATTTSGLAAGTSPQEKLAIWKPLGDWVKERREIEIKKESNIKSENVD